MIYIGMPDHLIEQIMQAEMGWKGKSRLGSEFYFKFKVRGRVRQSGDPYTSCFNNFIAVFVHLYLQLKTAESSGRLPPGWVSRVNLWCDFSWIKMLNNGDDNVSWSLWGPTPLEQFRALGLVVKPSDSFCKLYPLLDLGRIRLTRNPADFVVRFSYNAHNLRDSERRSVMLGNCISASYLVAGIPLLWILVHKLAALVSGTQPTFGKLESHTLQQLAIDIENPVLQPPVEPSVAIRNSFAETFGLSIERQLHFEHDFQSLAIDGAYRSDFCSWLEEMLPGSEFTSCLTHTNHEKPSAWSI